MIKLSEIVNIRCKITHKNILFIAYISVDCNYERTTLSLLLWEVAKMSHFSSRRIIVNGGTLVFAKVNVIFLHLAVVLIYVGLL